jgi:hypothetical protein
MSLPYPSYGPYGPTCQPVAAMRGIHVEKRTAPVWELFLASCHAAVMTAMLLQVPPQWSTPLASAFLMAARPSCSIF